MPTIPVHIGNANQTTSLLLELLLSRTSTTNVGEVVGEKEPSYTAGGNVS
jgi:hypothetical protein